MSSKSNKASGRLRLAICALALAPVVCNAATAQIRSQVADGVVVNIADAGLSKTIEIDRAKLAKAGPVTRVQVSIMNPSNRPVHVQYRAQWMSSDGFEVPTNDRWEPATIDAQTSRSIDLLGNDRNISNVIVNLKKQ